MITVLVLVGVVGLAIGFFGARYTHRHVRSRRLGWWWVQSLPIAAGAAASVLVAFRDYRATPTTEVIGVPFPIAAFENGHDFVGITSLPLVLANIAFFLLLPQIVLAIYFRSKPSTPKPKLVSVGPEGVYVDSSCCLDCGVPWTLAPEIFAEGAGSCVVKRQPSGATELRRVLRVFRPQDLNCIRYGGKNPRAVAILERAGCAEACDGVETT